MKKNNRTRKTWAILIAAGYTVGMLAGCNGFKADEEEPVFNKDLLNLSLTEIHYNPADDAVYKSDSLEFIEIKNTGSTSVPLKTLEVSGAISYVFPADSVLGAGKFYVIASSKNAFEERYGMQPDGIYTGQLGNSSGNILLRDVDFKELIFSQFYADSGAWSGKADGDGYSLVSTELSPDRLVTGAAAWKRSARRNGSPGKDDITIAPDATLFAVKISEINYNPLDFEGIPGDSLEFVELKNIGTEKVSMERLAFTNGIMYSFPENSTLDAGKSIVIVANSASFKKKYPAVTPFGEYSGQLNNAGEKVTLFDVLADTIITSVEYDDSLPWPEMADGKGATLVARSLEMNVNQNEPSQWRASYRPDGTPAGDDPGIVIFNEVLTHTDTPLVDAVELYNPCADTVDISGWYISDNKSKPTKYKIPDGTKVPAGGYIVFDASDFNADPDDSASFTLDSHGESVWLFSHEQGCDGGYCDVVEFGELDNGVSIGLYRTSTGEEMWVRQSALSLGKKNAGPRIGPLIISEIMYHPLDDVSDFIEVTNISAGEVFLSHVDIPAFTWKINGAAFSFPAGTSIKPDESVIIASDSISVEAFRNRYSVPNTVQVFQMTGNLKNSSENIELLEPANPFIDDSLVSADSTFPYVLIDMVHYDDKKPWPVEADGLGRSLQRTSGTVFGNDASSWKAAVPTPGKMD